MLARSVPSILIILPLLSSHCSPERRVTQPDLATFRNPIFQVAVTREGSDVVLLKEEDLPPSLPDPSEAGPSTPCSWWRRGGVEPPVQKTPHWNVLQVCPVLSFSPGRLSAGRGPIRPADYLRSPSSASGRTAPRFCVACSPSSGTEEGRRSHLRRLVRVVVRQLLFCRLFYEV